jgi:hypothetical protein
MDIWTFARDAFSVTSRTKNVLFAGTLGVDPLLLEVTPKARQGLLLSCCPLLSAVGCHVHTSGTKPAICLLNVAGIEI